jgi:SagB-type dehydrogenase family enzyme
VSNQAVTSETPWTAEQIGQRLVEIRRVVEEERRARFADFGIGPECLWPCSRLFHEHSSLGPGWDPVLSPEQVTELTQNLDYKRYPGAERLPLPRPEPLTLSLEAAIRKRRSIRQFSDRPIALRDLAKLLELSSGVTEVDEIPRRAAPSGGGLYPVETYALTLGVQGVPSALWHYAALEHELEHVRPLSGSADLSSFFPPGLLRGGPRLVLAFSVVFGRTQLKYIERGYRFGLLEAGHIAQNAVLTGTALGLGTLCVGGFWDDPFNRLLGLDSEREAVVYAVMLGHAADAGSARSDR